MVENKTRGEQLFAQDRGTRPVPGGENPLKKISGMFQSVRDLFGKPQAKGAAGTKKAGGLFAEILSAHKLDLKSINKTLAVVLTGLIVLMAYSVLRPRPDIGSVTTAVSKINFENFGKSPISAFQALTFYLEQVNKRDIFNEFEEKKPPPVVKPAELPPPPLPPKVTIQEKAKDLKLMGISWGSSPRVIIKNDATQEVLFLKKGEKIKGTELRGKDIKKDEVIIFSGEDEMKML